MLFVIGVIAYLCIGMAVVAMVVGLGCSVDMPFSRPSMVLIVLFWPSVMLWLGVVFVVELLIEGELKRQEAKRKQR